MIEGVSFQINDQQSLINNDSSIRNREIKNQPCSARIPHPCRDAIDCHDERVAQPRIMVSLAKAADDFYLYEVDWIHVWGPHVDRA